MDRVRVSKQISAGTRSIEDWESPPWPIVIRAAAVETLHATEADATALSAEHAGNLLVRALDSEAVGLDFGERTERSAESLLRERVGTPTTLSRAQAIELARRLFGSDPSLPPGAQYVKKVRGDWSLRLGNLVR